MIINKNNFKNSLLSRLITTILIILFFSLLIYYTWNINWRWLVITIAILIGASGIINIIDWYLQLYIVKYDKQKILFKIMKNRSYSQNFNSISNQVNIIVNLKKEWIYYWQVISVFFVIISPLFLILLNKLPLVFKLLLMMLIFTSWLLLNLYQVTYNNQHIILRYNSEVQATQRTKVSFIKITLKTKIKNIIKKIINFIPIYVSCFGLVAYIVISYQTLIYLYHYSANEIIGSINKNLVLIFFPAYNYVHIILYHCLIILFLTWLMQVIIFYLLDFNTFANNKKRLLIQICCFLNLFAIISFGIKLLQLNKINDKK